MAVTGFEDGLTESIMNFAEDFSAADAASWLVPGWDVGACALNGCSAAGWGIAAAGILPIGKLAKGWKAYKKLEKDKISGNNIVLGLDDTLKHGARITGAANYKQWFDKGLVSNGDMEFTAAFRQATSRADNIFFNLDGFKLQKAARNGGALPSDSLKNVTNWEFEQVVNNSKTVFFQNGRVVPTESVLERANK